VSDELGRTSRRLSRMVRCASHRAPQLRMKETSMADNTEKRGFASMDDDKQREIASKGGQAAHEKGTAHEFDSKEAREAGRKKGGESRGGSDGGQRGGTHEQHVRAGQQSHKND